MASSGVSHHTVTMLNELNKLDKQQLIAQIMRLHEQVDKLNVRTQKQKARIDEMQVAHKKKVADMNIKRRQSEQRVNAAIDQPDKYWNIHKFDRIVDRHHDTDGSLIVDDNGQAVPHAQVRWKDTYEPLHKIPNSVQKEYKFQLQKKEARASRKRPRVHIGTFVDENEFDAPLPERTVILTPTSLRTANNNNNTEEEKIDTA